MNDFAVVKSALTQALVKSTVDQQLANPARKALAALDRIEAENARLRRIEEAAREILDSCFAALEEDEDGSRWTRQRRPGPWV